jgi:hypothetical protein
MAGSAPKKLKIKEMALPARTKKASANRSILDVGWGNLHPQLGGQGSY